MAWLARFGALRLLALLILVAGSAGSVAVGRAWDAMAQYEDALYATRSLFLASSGVSRRDFATFVRKPRPPAALPSRALYRSMAAAPRT
jgi:hypothetical protein